MQPRDIRAVCVQERRESRAARHTGGEDVSGEPGAAERDSAKEASHDVRVGAGASRRGGASRTARTTGNAYASAAA